MSPGKCVTVEATLEMLAIRGWGRGLLGYRDFSE